MLFGRGCMTTGGVCKIVTRGSGRCPWKYISEAYILCCLFVGLELEMDKA